MVYWKSVTKTVSHHFPLIAKYVPGYALLYSFNSDEDYTDRKEFVYIDS